jgi:hypothetical protein
MCSLTPYSVECIGRECVLSKSRVLAGTLGYLLAGLVVENQITTAFALPITTLSVRVLQLVNHGCLGPGTCARVRQCSEYNTTHGASRSEAASTWSASPTMLPGSVWIRDALFASSSDR